MVPKNKTEGTHSVYTLINAVNKVLESGKLPAAVAERVRKQLVIAHAFKRAAAGEEALKVIREDIIPTLKKYGIDLDDYIEE